MNTQEAISKIISNILAQKDGDDLKLQDIAMINDSHELLTVIAVFAKEHELTMSEVETQLSVITKFIRTADTQLVDTTVDLLLSQDTGMTMFADGVKVRYKKGELAAARTYEDFQDSMKKVADAVPVVSTSPTRALNSLIEKELMEWENELSRATIRQGNSEFSSHARERTTENFFGLKHYDTNLQDSKEVLESESMEEYAKFLVRSFANGAKEAHEIIKNRSVTLDVKNRI